MKIYQSLLTEAEITSCVKSFGHELFGHELGGKEKNTGVENSYVRGIYDFTDNQFGEETTPEFYKALENLKGCMKQYPEVLMPEKTNVFRGTVIPLSYFVKNNVLISLTSPIPYVYKANSKIQSWSDSFDSAAVFGNNEMINDIADDLDIQLYNTPENRQQLLQMLIKQDLRLAFVLEYNTNPKEFIFKSKYFKILSHHSASNENELLRIDNKPIRLSASYNDTKNNFGATKKTMTLINYINQAIKESADLTN